MEFQQRFVFLQPEFKLVIAQRIRDESDVVMFRYVGQVLFRGFESSRPTPVYEILRTDSPFVRLAHRYHFSEWQAESSPDPIVTKKEA
jgi:hypothetical protein